MASLVLGEMSVCCRRDRRGVHTVQQEHPSQLEQEQEEQAQFPCMFAVV